MASGGWSDDNMSEETFAYICTACADTDVIKEGVKYCVECKGYCCAECVSLHATYLPLKQHSLLDISSSLLADQLSKLPAFPTERCSIHQGKIIDMYCGSHNVVGCYVCIATNHLNCKDIHSIAEDVDMITKDGEFDQTSKDLQTLIQKVQSLLGNSNDILLKKLEDNKQTSLLAISEHRREMDSMLDRLEKEAKAGVESSYNQLKSELVSLNEKLEVCLNKCIDLAERNRRADGNKSQKFVCTKLATSSITDDQHDIDNIIKDLLPFERYTLLAFVADNSLIAFLKQLEEFGHLKVKDARELYRVTEREDIVVRIPSDTTECRIQGCCLVGENQLLITDNANKKLKRVDIGNVSVIDYIGLPSDIHGVCCVNNNEVAVACWDEKMIQFVSIQQTMSPTYQIQLNHNCFYVAYIDNKLYVSDDGGGSVYIYDMMGTLLQTTSKDSSGDKLCKYSGQIALADNEDYLFVGGFNRLVFLDKKGKHIATVNDPDIDGAEGVCIDGRGSVFVAGRNSVKIVQYRYDGTKIGVVVKKEDGINTPSSLCFHRQLNKLFATLMYNDKIKMFDLE